MPQLAALGAQRRENGGGGIGRRGIGTAREKPDTAAGVDYGLECHRLLTGAFHDSMSF